MKKNLTKAFIAILASLMLTTTFTSCGDDEKKDPETTPAVKVSKSYTINTYVDNARNFFPPKSYSSAGETMIVAADPANENKTVNIQYTSQSQPSWGVHTFTNVAVEAQDNTYRLTGNGKAQIASSRDGSIGTYDTTIDATVKDGNITGEINIPGVMGGITIHINPADFDDVINQ